MHTYVEDVAKTKISDFEAKLRDKPIVLIYPRNRGRSALIAMILQHYQHNVLYYGLKEDDTDLLAWLNHIVVDESLPVTFGTQTRDALAAKASPEELAAAFGADLSGLRSDSFVLLVDMFDRMESDERSNRFFRALPHHMASHAQLALDARLIDLQPWNDLVHAGLVGVVGTDEALGGGIYGDKPDKGQLEVFALSGGHVYIDGRPVNSWDGSLPRHLFYFFVDHPMVTRDEIFSVFWPKMTIKEATNVFHVTKRKISERLGYELTNYQSGFYVPSPRLTVHYDVRVFEDAVHQAIEEEGENPAAWYQAIQLYRAEFLTYIDTPWVEQRREQLKHKYAQALIGLGRYHRNAGESDVALGYLLRALREKPDWEDVHQDVMKIYQQQGRIDDAVVQYRLLENTLQRMFNIRPSKDTRQLYETITKA